MVWDLYNTITISENTTDLIITQLQWPLKEKTEGFIWLNKHFVMITQNIMSWQKWHLI